MKPSSTVHFVGISGIGMSALARILLQRGVPVTGSSDVATPLTAELQKEGATVAIGHEPKNLGAAQTVVVSSAIADDNPEVVAARERGLEIVHRGKLLARLMEGRRGIAIAGTHGKTTTSAMIAAVLEAGGFEPTFAVGGERIESGTNAREGKGEWFVAESDESDGSFLELRPEIGIVTNLENDHVASDMGFATLIVSFETFLANIPSGGLALVGIDERHGTALARHERAARTRTFGTSPDAQLRARDLSFASFGSRSTIIDDGTVLGELRLNLPGEMNVRNALPAIAIGRELGLAFEAISSALESFRGVRRRFEIKANVPRMMVVDDYAHHPTAVAATIAAARRGFDGAIVVAFQPHRYSRTSYLAADFARALSAADHVLLTEIYAASEEPIAGVDARSIGEPLRALGTKVEYVDVTALASHLRETAPQGALVLFLGAGSITNAATNLAQELSLQALFS